MGHQRISVCPVNVYRTQSLHDPSMEVRGSFVVCLKRIARETELAGRIQQDAETLGRGSVWRAPPHGGDVSVLDLDRDPVLVAGEIVAEVTPRKHVGGAQDSIKAMYHNR